MYTLTSVAKRYPKGRRAVPAVQDLTLTIDDGQWLAVQGRTGHGKSTLLNLLGGLDRPTSGHRRAGRRRPGRAVQVPLRMGESCSS